MYYVTKKRERMGSRLSEEKFRVCLFFASIAYDAHTVRMLSNGVHLPAEMCLIFSCQSCMRIRLRERSTVFFSGALSSSVEEIYTLLAPQSRHEDKTLGVRLGKKNRSWKWAKQTERATSNPTTKPTA